MYIFLIIVGIIILLLLICYIRAKLLKPTAAHNATLPVVDEKRSQNYGESLAKMIQVETVSSPEQEDLSQFYQFHKVLESLFPKIHKELERYDFDGSLLYKWKGHTDGEPILLMSHLDVVEASGKWTHDAFGGQIEDGVIYGRGSVDTKSSLFCIFQAVEELLEEGVKPSCDVYIASSCTEEVSGPGAPATVDYLKKQGVHLKLVIDEGGFLLENPLPGVKGLYAMVGVAEKSMGGLKFTAKSAGGHASVPGKNTPLVRLGQFMADIEKHNPFKKYFSDTVEEMFRRLSPNMNFRMKYIFSNLWLFEPILKRVLGKISPQGGAMLQTTIAFTQAEGSTALNVLPKEASIKANARFIHHQPTDESIELITKIAKKYDIETETILYNKMYPVTDYRGEQFKYVEEAIQKVFPGVDVCPNLLTAGTDAKLYTEICDNVMRFAPLYVTNKQLSTMHTINENLNIDSLPLAVDFYKYIIKN